MWRWSRRGHSSVAVYNIRNTGPQAIPFAVFRSLRSRVLRPFDRVMPRDERIFILFCFIIISDDEKLSCGDEQPAIILHYYRERIKWNRCRIPRADRKPRVHGRRPRTVSNNRNLWSINRVFGLLMRTLRRSCYTKGRKFRSSLRMYDGARELSKSDFASHTRGIPQMTTTPSVYFYGGRPMVKNKRSQKPTEE